MESREYGISTPGSDGEYGGQVRKEQDSTITWTGTICTNPELVTFRLSVVIFVSYVKRERRICYQSDHGAVESNRLLREYVLERMRTNGKREHLTPAKAEKLRYYR